MTRKTPLLLLLFAAAAWADPADAFFDDTRVGEVRLVFENPNWYSVLFQSHQSDPNDPNFPASFSSTGVNMPRIGVRFKGNSSFRRNGIKKPFKLDFNEYDDDGAFLGLKKLNLHPGDLQPDFMHEKLFLDFAGKYLAAMRATYVRLYINEAYYGLYLAVEQPDKVMMRQNYGDSEDGNLWEAGESGSATMAYLGANPSSYTRLYELKTNEEANDYSGLIELLDILNNTPVEQLPERLEKLMDVENFLRAMALNAIFTNVESYTGTAGEYFLYDRSSDGRFVHVHWDLNETFGSTGDGTPRIANVFTFDLFWLPTGGAQSSRPLLTRLWSVPKYRRAYLQFVARTLREGFDEGTFRTRVTQIADMIRPHLAEDPNKPYTMAQFEQSLTDQVTANNFTTFSPVQFVRERAAHLNTLLGSNSEPGDLQLSEIGSGWVELSNWGPGRRSTSGYTISDDPAQPGKWTVPSQDLAASAYLVVPATAIADGATVKLYAGGTEVDSVTIPARSAALAVARVGQFGNEWKLTTTVTQGTVNVITGIPTTPEPPGTGNGRLLINELMADNDSSFPDPDEAGAFDDWIEIYNPGNSAIDMGGMYLTDNLSNPVKWRIPAGVTAPAKGYVIFIADSSAAQGPQHTSWGLSADGEAVGLYEADGTTLVDSVTFGPQRGDIAHGRTTDGAADFSLFRGGTPGAANAGALANWIRNGSSFSLTSMAPDSIASAFAQGITSSTVVAQTSPLPQTLGGVSVTVTDSAGSARQAGLYFAAAGQVNFLIPGATATGRATVAVRKQDGSTVSGAVWIHNVAPGLFSANATGNGVALLAAVRADAAGAQTALEAFRYDEGQRLIVGVPISLGTTTDQTHLVLYGSGVRRVGALNLVTASVGGTSVPVTFAGAQSEFAGLDQINIGPLPRALAGRGSANLYVTVDGQRSNTVTVLIQ